MSDNLDFYKALNHFRYLHESNLSNAEKAAKKLSDQLHLGSNPPTWLAGIGVVLDPSRSRAAVQVSVKQGYNPSELPKRVDGVPVVVTKSPITGTLPF